MTQIETDRLDPASGGVARAVAVLRAGGRVAFPTETVYGLGADARDGAAVAGIYAAKGRPSFNPLIAHVADIATARRYVHWSDLADRVAQAFWPGPLTLVLPLREDAGISPLVTAGLSTLAVRVPAHPLAQELLRAFDGPLAAPSANPSGRISPTLPDHVLAGLDGEIEAVLMGGASEVGVESTILWLAPAPVLLRPGGLPAEALEAMLGAPLETGGSAEAPSAPGQLLSHYAPEAGLRMDATEARAGEVLLGFGPVSGAMSLSESGDLHEAAARLFGALHALDGQASVIAVAPIPEVGLGRAINDRLRRAAAPR
ncbi:MAG: L-threonylcarbamoyladenylate synthase [Marinovum algicola]|uniref:Threonylcarbamoyl-AMP synthase n=2 Tax=Marinovum algicola TaxID=42444 RepID=A0A975W9I7_9RHOB|nr:MULTISPECIES: L-threonylcarbamoyladenylate synthase [Marinovum]MDD9741888.1 L-threonylcarbamoyladenylate synthase [Marinovum sp. SP66]MDD9744978.1 L-threonylcarbamoyladenylate synthase [Marinovum sp. PR37]SEJ37020.1 translation factor SUA5 [Marinovum algicola]SLN39352.1 Threonylcarbamoyl-AMP synthase [Marinovum algicola]